MNELRKDYLLDEWVIIAAGRGKRPNDFTQKQEAEEETGTCFFCPGNEHLTPPEISRVEADGKWAIRVFPNKFPAVSKDEAEPSGGLLSMQAAYGVHEIVADTNDHAKTLSDMPVEHIVCVFDVYMERIEALSADERTKYVAVFKNHKKMAGASLSHSHTQIISTSMLPPLVRREADAVRQYSADHGSCPHCDAWRGELQGDRRIADDEYTAAFAPYASRFNFEAMVLPKRHVANFSDLDGEERISFCATLKNILVRLRNGLGDPGYNYFLHYAPGAEDLHFHLKICPKLSTWAGFEHTTGIIINTMPPETAAAFYRGEETS